MPKTDISISKKDMPYRVGVWPVSGFAMMSCASVLEPLRAANFLADQPPFDVNIFTESEGARSSAGAIIEGTHPIGATPPLDLFLIVAGGNPFEFDNADALAWVRTMASSVPIIGGVSGGPVILTKAGVMGGRQFTVHWEHAAELTKRFPDVSVKRRLFTLDSDRVTCGGGTAPLDLMHALIARRLGSPFARLVSDWFLHTEVRAAGAPQRSRIDARPDIAHPTVAEAIAVMEDHLSDPLSLSQLGLMTNVSPRHLNRLFETAVGQSAMAFYRRIRLDAAHRLLVTSQLDILSIAEATGFASASHFSNQFHQTFGFRPSGARNAEKRPV